MPELSALITVHNRAAALTLLLDALENQTLSADRFEIIIVDDGSTDGTKEIVERKAAKLPLKYFYQRTSGAAAAKNLAVLVTKSPLLLPLHVDEIPDADCFVAHLAAHIRHPYRNGAILGLKILAPGIASTSLMRHVATSDYQFFPFASLEPRQMIDHNRLLVGHCSMKREFMVYHGMFDMALDGGCEDAELGWRAHQSQLQIFYEPDAISTEQRALTFAEFRQSAYRKGVCDFKIAQLHGPQGAREHYKIDDALRLWAKERVNFKAFLRWVERLDDLATERTLAGVAMTDLFARRLGELYRRAYQLGRAKGIADELSRNPLPVKNTDRRRQPRCILDYGISAPPAAARQDY